MAFSWGGVARRLSDRIEKNQDAALEEESYARRKKMEMELEKQYGAEVVARTAIEGNEEVYYNRYGDRMKSRLLTAEELRLRQAEMDKTLADARSSTADAGLAEFNLETAPRRLALDEEQTRASIDSSRASAAAAMGNLGLARERHAWETGGGKGLPKNLENGVDEVRTMIHALGASNGINTADGLEQVFEAELNAAKVAGDLDEVRRVIARYKGQLSRPYTRAKTEDTTRSTGGFSLDGSSGLPAVPGSY